jgi:hypothetical protein
MAKHIIKNNLGYFAKICEDDASKDFWIKNGYPQSEQITDQQANDIKKAVKEWLQADQGAVSELVTNPRALISIEKEDVKESLNNIISNMEKYINNYENTPAIWNTTLTTLKAVNLDNLSFPIEARNWIDALDNNGISILSLMEF